MAVPLSSAGDVNGDGFDDSDHRGRLSLTRMGMNRGRSKPMSYLWRQRAGFGASLDLSSLNGSNGFVVNGINPGDTSGGSVSSAGDVNGDGFDDLIIGATATLTRMEMLLRRRNLCHLRRQRWIWQQLRSVITER